MSRPRRWPTSRRRSPRRSSSIPARCGCSPSTSAAVSARRPRSAPRPSSRSSSRKPQRRRSGSRSTGTKNCQSPGIGREPKSRSRFLPGRDGALKALSLTAYSDAGVAVNSTVAGLARLIYRAAEAKELVDHDVVSNLPPGCAFRAPGGPPMAFALEQAIDEAALRLGTDAIALRKRWDPNPDRQRLYDWAGGLEAWRLRARGAAADRPLPARRRRRDGLLALSLAASNEGRACDRGRPSRRRHRGAGHRHRHPQRHRRHGRARIRARSARGRGPHRRFEAARGADIRRQPGHRVDRAAAPRRRRQAQGRHRREDRTKAGARDRTRRGANSSPPRPISRSRRSARKTIRGPPTATIRWSRTPA